MKLSEELEWRGFVNQTTIKKLSLIDKKSFCFYHGFDASMNSLTIGNLAAVMLDKCFIRHGHKAIIISGGATSLIGDPGGKDKERPLQPVSVVRENVTLVHGQLKNILGSSVIYLNNYDWLSKMSVLDFLRDVGKYFSMTPLIQRDYIAKRIGPGGTGISYTELSYTLLQGYDYLYLNQKYGVNLQLAGSDQWGNCLSGVELIKKVINNDVDVFTCPLIINQSTGKKFGKSEDGAIWLDPKQTSPLDFYQFWINSDDLGVESYLKIFTELDKSTIEDVVKQHKSDQSKRIAQKRLAYEVTKMIHGKETTDAVVEATNVLTGITKLDSQHKDVISQLASQLKVVKVSQDVQMVDLLLKSGLAESKTEALRLLASSSIYIDNIKYQDDMLHLNDHKSKLLLLRRGKALKDTVLIELVK
jgi:tyrosyl-tRNA synthetase